MSLKAGLEKDITAEKKAVRDYTQRISQAKGSGVTPVLKHIRGEEKEHKVELSSALKGLKSVRNYNE